MGGVQVEVRQEIPAVVQDKRFSIRSWVIIFVICLIGTLILISGFLVLEFGLIELISNDEQLFGVQGVFTGVTATIIAPFLLLLGYPILIHLYKRSMV
jgi:hypothetical protein